ncbi:uncharacterized protein I303_100387 [Kwoniella dejecticola CBS 10117]|uniref:COQ9 C-terminal domain-containing protein n=1 Tax=Kwoniella dejecticola CBS 10117 TaxID=1296121 RepID=A0A1A6AES0_9TREE|nr:uncharacterized protein I303_00387 [Kwoniella dejecticola CBS 10117]OBR88570.1 hypothetical protein I303_00387 [Kwoniella dejecticola CBS 10117]
MALRQQILSSALPLLPTHSFTRSTLSQALRSLKPQVSNSDGVIDTIFGNGSVAPSRALVDAWQEEGLRAMSSSKETKEDLGDVLKRRITYSAGVGEHLVEAYANLTTPSSTPSIPLPSIPILRTLLSTVKIPPSYVPPALQPSNPPTPTSASSILDQMTNATGHRIPLSSINPLGPLSYAWRIADEALFLNEQKGKVQGSVRRGYWNEPTGPGPEWYTKRIGLSIVYLASESALLQPYPVGSTTTMNPYLDKSLAALDTNLERYKSILSSLERSEENMGDVANFVDYVARSWGGLIKSRYL